VSIQTVGAIEVTLPLTGRAVLRPHEDEALEEHRAQNDRSLRVLRRLGLGDGTELALWFSFESLGADRDCALAEQLQGMSYRVLIEPAGVSGWTAPMPVDRETLDEWVATMLRLARTFSGWTATIARS
jgi:hypothetical protein